MITRFYIKSVLIISKYIFKSRLFILSIIFHCFYHLKILINLQILKISDGQNGVLLIDISSPGSRNHRHINTIQIDEITDRIEICKLVIDWSCYNEFLVSYW